MDTSAPVLPGSLAIPVDLFVSLKHADLGFVDSNGDLVYKVKRRSSSHSSSHDRILLDAAGIPLISMSPDDKGCWKGFKGNCGDELLFRVQKIKNTLTRTELEVFLAGENLGDNTSDFNVRGCPFMRACTIYSGNNIVAQNIQTAKLVLYRNLLYAKRIGTLIDQGQSCQALTLFHQLQKTGSKITEFLLSATVRACGRLAAIKEGKQFHCMVIKHGFNRDMVLVTSLLDMYSKCTQIGEARRVFDEMPERDVIACNSMISGLCLSHLTSEAVDLFNNMSKRDVGSWNSLISGLGQHSEGRTALFFYERMRLEGAQVDGMTMVSVLAICADLAALLNGKQIHGLVIKNGYEHYLPIGNAMVDMYTKCGCMDDACLCFRNMPSKNVVSWSTLIVGYGKQGLGLEALQAFVVMEMEGIQPNEITFLGVLYACSHAGLVQEGWRIFNIMIHKYSINPMMEHYTCMVDLLARAGHLQEASNFIEKMPMKPDAKLLTAFLSSCFTHKDFELARSGGEKLLELEPQEAGAYMLLSNLYGIVGDLERVAKVRRLMSNRGIRKEKARTWIEINKTIHSFESGDRSHPLSKEVHKYLHNLVEKMKTNGYVPNTSMVMQNVDKNTKEEIVLGHSEKLAVGLGLISTVPGTRIMIVKNLRMCIDCHEVTRLISKMEMREIVARDSNRFHHFKDGACSCGNHW